LGITSNTTWNLIGSVTPLLLGVATLPYIYTQLGIERVGVLTLVWALIGYFSIFDFGLGRAITQRIAADKQKLPDAEIDGVIGAGIAFALILGIAGFLITSSLFLFFRTDVILSSKALSAEINTAVILACCGIPATTITTAYRGVLEGTHKFKAANLLRLLLGVSNFLGPVVTIYFLGANLAYIVAMLISVRFLAVVIHHRSCESALGRKIMLNFGREEVVKFLPFMGWITVSNLVSPLMVLIDRFLIASILGLGVVAFYTIPADILMRTLILPAALTSTLFPLFSELNAKRNLGEIDVLYKKSIVLIFSIMTLIACGAIFAGEFGLTLWLGENFAQKAAPIASILAVGVLLNGLAQVPHAYIQATGDAKSTALIHLAEAILYIPALLLMVHLYGLFGAAIAWTSRALLDFVILHVRARIVMRISM
jgi:O-antigen/teichoic acid export membrane protein